MKKFPKGATIELRLPDGRTLAGADVVVYVTPNDERGGTYMRRLVSLVKEDYERPERVQ